MKKPELLAPAGNMECFDAALRFGADAVYIGGQQFGLRAFAGNFAIEQVDEAVKKAHSLDRKVYVTVNALMREDELKQMRAYMKELAKCKPDGIIFSDPAVLAEGMKLGLSMHLSTQASTMNSAACTFWYHQGVERVVLAREATLEEIRTLCEEIPDQLEIEAFVHGAMCIAHSGRCLMSGVMTGRSGNRGECAQPCRWEYELREKGTDDAFYPVFEDGRGTYVFNSKDLLMLDKLPDLMEAGVDSFKIEGRMKSAYYVASVVHAYRKAIDECMEGRTPSDTLREELEKSATRLFTRGFFYGAPGADGQDTVRDWIPRRYTFVAKVLEQLSDGYIRIEQRNKFSVGETIEILSPETEGVSFTIEDIRTTEDEKRTSAPHAQEILLIKCPVELKGGEFLRRLDPEESWNSGS